MSSGSVSYSGQGTHRPAPAPPQGSTSEPVPRYLTGSGSAPNEDSLPPETTIHILKTRVHDLQNELQREKHDHDSARDRIAELVGQYTEEKNSNTVLVNKSVENIKKLNASEEAARRLEDALMAEQASHKNTRQELDEWKEKYEKLMLQNKDQRKQMDALNSSSRGSPTMMHQSGATAAANVKDVLDMEEKHRQYMDGLRQEVAESMARLANAKEDDDTAVFVARSAALSCAAELEAKLDRLEHQLSVISQDVVQMIREQEDEMSRMVIGLLEENKDLWTRLNAIQFECDKLRTEMDVKSRSLQGPGKEHVDQLNATIEGLEEKLRAANNTITNQNEKFKEHESKMDQLLQDHKNLQQRFTQLEEECKLLREQNRGNESALNDAYRQRDEAEAQAQELQRLNAHQAAQIRSLSEQLKSLEDTKLMELRNQLRAAQNERDDANALAQRYLSELEDANSKAQRANEELASRTEKFNAYKAAKEDELSELNWAHQQKQAQSQEAFDQTLNDLRSEIKALNDELHATRRDLNAVSESRAALKAEARVREDELADAQNELQRAEQYRFRLEERLKALQEELDRTREENLSDLNKRRDIDAEHSRLQEENEQLRTNLDEERRRHVMTTEQMTEQWNEIDHHRKELETELHQLKLKVCDDDSVKSHNARLERDLDQLRHENDRLHRQYQEVLRQSNDDRAAMTRMKQHDSATLKQQQQIDELQMRLKELPELRHSLEESKRETHRLREETQVLLREKQELEARLSRYVDENRKNLKKEADFDRILKDANHQMRRLDQQIDETNTTIQVKAQNREAPTSSRYGQRVDPNHYNYNTSGANGGARGGTPRGRLNFA